VLGFVVVVVHVLGEEMIAVVVLLVEEMPEQMAAEMIVGLSAESLFVAAAAPKSDDKPSTTYKPTA
jgi:hypothetical protein